MFKLLEILQEDFDKSNLSGTFPRNKTQNFLENYPLNRRWRSANQNFFWGQIQMHLHKTVLKCNRIPLEVLYKRKLINREIFSVT
jgi:hypothetical protein